MTEQFLFAAILSNLLGLPIAAITRRLLFRRGRAVSGLVFARVVFVGLACLPWLSLLLAQLAALPAQGALTPIALGLQGLTPGMAVEDASHRLSAAGGTRLALAVDWTWFLVSASMVAQLVSERRRFGQLAKHAIDVDVGQFNVSLPRGLRVGATAAPVDAFVSGIRAPRIVVPLVYVNRTHRQNLTAVLRHEVAHIHQNDTLWLPLCRLFLCLSWPVAPLWWVYRDLRLQTELAADQNALRGAGAKHRRHYARALIEAMGSPTRQVANSLPGFHPVTTRRIRMRLSHAIHTSGPDQQRAGRLLAAVLAASLLIPAFCFQTAMAAGVHGLHFLAPLQAGWISSAFGPRPNPFTGGPAYHHGVDIAAPAGTPVLVPAAGTVTFVGHRDKRKGLIVEVRHADGFRTVYMHLHSALVKTGQVVSAGTPIATVGNSGKSLGAHLHLELYRGSKLLDPARYMPLDYMHDKRT
ncbi:MAG: M23/M56 family metallopeptidase [Gammaproteobacteria bacterium]|jgi:Zn-dependent protease with chaperone function